MFGKIYLKTISLISKIIDMKKLRYKNNENHSLFTGKNYRSSFEISSAYGKGMKKDLEIKYS
ncbi:hypothetical protein [Methanosarcina sp.]|uniref:hypothetical protein n=1 Tax=Methanosarcina sp. TaxID=2213 RepID=UPI002AB8EA3C|nr:hypothetical protein [Methanosarcina sp.]MDY9927833.1 hypothetical protein [Methanosarcina sp.]